MSHGPAARAAPPTAPGPRVVAVGVGRPVVVAGWRVDGAERGFRRLSSGCSPAVAAMRRRRGSRRAQRSERPRAAIMPDGDQAPPMTLTCMNGLFGTRNANHQDRPESSTGMTAPRKPVSIAFATSPTSRTWLRFSWMKTGFRARSGLWRGNRVSELPRSMAARSLSSSSRAPTIPTTQCWLVGCTTICAGATTTPDTPASSPHNIVNARVRSEKGTRWGGQHPPQPPDQPGQPTWTAHQGRSGRRERGSAAVPIGNDDATAGLVS